MERSKVGDLKVSVVLTCQRRYRSSYLQRFRTEMVSLGGSCRWRRNVKATERTTPLGCVRAAARITRY